MEEFKGQTIFLSIIGIATLLVAIIGATFAWFNVSLNGEDDTKNIVIKTATLSSITFEDGAEIDASGIFPGTVKTKTFTIAQTDSSATESIPYVIKLNVKSNTLTENANGAFIHSLVGEGNTNGGTLANMEEKEVPVSSEIIGNGTLLGYEAHTYTYTITLKNLDEDQNACLNKEFSGYISASIGEVSN